MNIRAAVSKDGDENLEGQKEEPRVCYDDSKCEYPGIKCDDCLRYKILTSYEAMAEKKPYEVREMHFDDEYK